LFNFEFHKPDYVDFVELLAANIGVPFTNKLLQIPDRLGRGYVWAERLPMGITILVSETTMHQEFTFTRHPTTEEYFSLQFNEYSSEVSKKGTLLNKNRYGLQQQSAARLSSTATCETYVLPEGVSLQTVRFFFNAEQLSHLLGPAAMNDVLTRYFPFLLKHDCLEPIATEYRVTLNELQVSEVTVPLRLNYIQNRVLLLLEKFILRLSDRQDLSLAKAKRTDDETLRLMKVETLLVKNFSQKGPKIDELSKISAMSPTKLKNDFKRMYGLPIYEYRQKNRMLKAKSLLSMGKFSIKEVGSMVGYTNLSHFAQAFKKEFNLLPSELYAKDGVLVYNT